MSRNLIPLTVTATLMAGTALADVPRVAVDIAPVHSLVTRVMEGVGMPALVIQPGASPHEYNLRPSDAQALQDADIVFWIGADLTPWMKDSLETLADDATITSLLDADGTVLLEFREGALFETHAHGEEAQEDDHDHDHAEHEDEDHDHDEQTAEDHDHAHGDHDPHAWLAFENANTWLNVIAAKLSAADPDNAGLYFVNAASARSELDILSDEVKAILDPVRGGRFIVFHDAYQYFEAAFRFPASGAISIGDAADPSPARISEIRARVKKEDIQCVLSEPQFNPDLVATVTEGTDVNTAVLDPLGSDLETGAALYPTLMRNLANALADCLS